MDSMLSRSVKNAESADSTLTTESLTNRLSPVTLNHSLLPEAGRGEADLVLSGSTTSIANDAVKGCCFTCWQYRNSSTCNISPPRPDLFEPDIFACDDAENGIFRTIKFGGKFVGLLFFWALPTLSPLNQVKLWVELNRIR